MQTAIYHGSIEKKFIKLIFLLISFIILCGYLFFVGWYTYKQNSDRLYLAKSVTQVLTQDFVRLMLIDDISTASDITTKLQALKNVQEVVLYDKNNKKFFKYEANYTLAKGEVFSTTTSVIYNDVPYGKLSFKMRVESLEDILLDNSITFALFLLFFMALSFVLVKSYARRFTSPILNLVDFLDNVEFDKDISKYKIKIKDDNEFGKLYEEVNFLFSKLADYFKEKESAQKELTLLTQYDPLTGLYNKNAFLKALEESLTQENIMFNIMFNLKLQNLKSINHAYGFKYGDLILKEYAKEIKENFSDVSLSARVGVGEFLLYYENIDSDKKRVFKMAQGIADALLGSIAKIFEIQGKLIKTEVIIGIDIFNQEKDPLKILRHTDIAIGVGQEKQQEIIYFDKKNENTEREILNVSRDLLLALKEEQLELFYQLQYDVKERVIGAEALIRWNHPKFGLLSPVKFIPIAERTNLILEIGAWVLESACKQLKVWQSDPIAKEWVIAVNVSVKQFNRDDFVSKVTDVIEKYKINPRMLKLELLETLFVDNQEKIALKMQNLRKLHIKLSLDDFGTGYSSLQYLKTFPLDQIKIDQSFIMNMFNNEKDIKIIKSILYLGSLLGINVIAEGVEEKVHYEKLKELGCNFYQGYYFAKPKSIKEIEIR